MPLDVYRRKRDFSLTSEPRGAPAARAGHAYLIQKHAARRLHYDLRLEMDGVLKSWAVTRGPSLVPGEKRLAVHVEDHPLDYGSFEGTIPKGQCRAARLRKNLRDRRRQRRLAMVNMANRPNVAVRLRTVELLFGHNSFPSATSRGREKSGVG
ncbi:Uncharacterised protein [Starkeya nomas]|uniref:DNA ligase D 3'-phosphoesterase domain-containing protein n=1 Tax=Starkeya nomas TaxID=2666134 RepID=A0A5S9NGL0_9HYPH|nr:Uncharacterised protein [Starkeya nomas]